MISFIIGELEEREVIRFIDDLIMQDMWYENFENLCLKSFYSSVNINNLLHSNIYQVSRNEMQVFETNFFLRSLKNLKDFKKSKWTETYRQIYNYLIFKKKYFTLTSNEIAPHFHRIIDDFELRRDGLSGILKVPQDLVKILNNVATDNSN